MKSLIDKKIYKKFLYKEAKIYKFFPLRISSILIIDDGIKKKVVKYSYKKKIINDYINELIKEVPNTILGIENLKFTYIDDIDILNKLDIIKKGLLTCS